MKGHGLAAFSAARIAAFAVTFIIASTAFADFYAVQVGAYPDELQARDKQRQLQNSSYLAVVRYDAHPTYPYKVTLGQYDAKVEADAYCKQLKETLNEPNLWVVTRFEKERAANAPAIPITKPVSTDGINDADPADLQEYLDIGGFGPLPTVPTETLQKAPQQMLKDELYDVGRRAVADEKDPAIKAKSDDALQRFIAAETATERTSIAKVHLMRSLGKKAENQAAVDSLLIELQRSPNTKHRKVAEYIDGFAKLNQKKYPEAAARFCALASDTSLPPYFRKKALLHGAVTLHYHVKDKGNAWLAYTELEKVNDQEISTKASVEMIALQFEQAGCEKGTMEDVRKMCLRFLSSGKYAHTAKATVALMELETYFEESKKLTGQARDQKLQTALERVRNFLATYSDVKREADLAHCWQALFLMQLGHLQEARDGFDIVLNLPENKTEQFAGVNPQATAALYAAVIAARQGDTAARDYYINIVMTRFAGTREAETCATLFNL